MPRCNGTNKDDTRCKKILKDGASYCSTHAMQAYSVPAIDTSPDSHLLCIEETAPKTPPPESPKKSKKTKNPVANVIITRQVSFDITNPSSSRPVIDLGLVSPPKNVREPTRRRARIPSDVGGAYCPIDEHHGLGGINGTSVDETSHAGGWLGMLRSLAISEESSSSSTADIDFERLSRLAALHKGLSTCCAVGCAKEATLGAHVWVWRTSLDTPSYDMKNAYIVPSCSEHNARKYDRRFGAAFECKKDTPAMKMFPRSDYADYIQK